LKRPRYCERCLKEAGEIEIYLKEHRDELIEKVKSIEELKDPESSALEVVESLEEQIIENRKPKKRKRIEGHHWSYYPDHWLDVIWLCAKCHREEHRRNPPTFPPPDIMPVDTSEDPALLEDQ